MIVLLSGGPPAIRHALPAWVGGLITPIASGPPTPYIVQGRPWAMDNAAFGAWDAAAYWRMLVRWQGTPGCVWVTVPDVVADHAATARRWASWAWLVKSLGYPLAYVAQDGLTPDVVPWAHLAALFIGGSTAWKLGPAARACITAAQLRDKWVHMGRVNTAQRVAYAHTLGCTSIDGTGWSRFWNVTARRSGPHVQARQPYLLEVA